MAIIESQVRITGQDAGVAAMFDKIAAKVDRMAKGAKISSPFSNLANDLTLAETKLRALDKVGSTKAISDLAKQRAAATKAALEESRQLVAATEAPTKAMQRDLAAREAAHAKAISMYRREATVAMEARRAAAAQGINLHDQAGAQAALHRAIDSTTAAMERQVKVERAAAQQAATAHAAAERMDERRAHFLAHHGIVGTMAGAAAGAVGVHTVLGVAERAWEAGAERQHVETGMRTAGMPQEEIDRAQAQAQVVSRQAPNLSVSQIMELHKEARSAVQHPEEVFELMPDLARAASVLKGMGADNANIADLVKGGESLGLMNNPERFHKYLEGQVKAMQVMGKTITTEQVYEAAKYSKATGSTLSDEFLNTTLPSLIQEMHGSSAGDALSAMGKRFDGGLAHQHLAVLRLNQMGLLDDPSKIVRSKTGEIIGYTGKLKGDDLRHSDPGKWFQTFYKEGAAKIGAKSLEDINKLLAETLPSTAANLGRIFIQQEETLKQHRINYEGATGLEETVRRQQQDWNAAKGALKASLEDLGASLTGVNMGRAAKGLSWLSDRIRQLSAVAAAHPYIAVPTAGAALGGAAIGAGYLGWQLATAGTALQTSATMLDEAAVRLGANPLRSAIPGAATVAEAGGAVVEGGALATGGIGLAAGLGTAGTIAGLLWLIKASQDAQRPGQGGAWASATAETREQDEDALTEQKGRLGDLEAKAERSRAAAKFPDMPNPVLQQLEDEIADLRNQIAAREASLAKVPKYPIGPTSDGGAPTMLGFDVDRGRKGGLTLPNMPMVPFIGGNGFLSGVSPYAVAAAPVAVAPQPIAAPAVVAPPAAVPAGIPSSSQQAGQPLDIRPPAQREAMAAMPPTAFPMGSPQTVDVTGKVQADVTSHVETAFTNRIEITGLPAGVTATPVFQSQATRVSTGPSMLNAGAAPHVARRDE